LKVVLILAIVFLAALLRGGSSENLRSTVTHAGGVQGFFVALVAALWAYDGWNNLTMVSSEIQNPQKNIPRSLILGILAVMGIYLAANVAYFYVLSASEVAAADRVASEAARKFLGDQGRDAVALAAMISIFAALNGSILSGARVPYALAKDGYFFGPLGRVHPQHRTPHYAILALSAWGALLVLSGSYEQLFTYVIFSGWIFYGLTGSAVFVLRSKCPEMERPCRVLGYPYVPAVFVTMAAALVAMTLWTSPRESLLGLALIALGFPFYLHWTKR
jgi:amino acid transporter